MVDDPYPKLLLVEGVDDEEVVKHIRNRYQHLPAFEILNKQGFPELSASITPELKAPGRTALGIMVDANADLPARWQTLSSRLREVRIPPPSQLPPAGAIIDHSPHPRVGIWLMPDNKSSGELEDFVERLIPSSDPVWPLAQDYINNIPANVRKFKSHKVMRAQVHAWLAARSRPRQMGTAIKARDLDATAPLAKCFVAWLSCLFG